MSDDKLLPEFVHRLHPRFRTPYISILLSAVIVSVMVIFTFGDLLIIDISLYGGALALEFIALIVMRRKFPLEERPFRIPFGSKGIYVVAFFPLLVYAVALTAAVMMLGRSPLPVGIALACLLSAEAGWQLVHRRKSFPGNASAG
jgi:amino acid transporter